MSFVREKKIGWANLVLLVISLGSSGCSVFKPGFIREDSYEVEPSSDNAVVEGIDGPTGGHFDDNGNWIPDNPDIPMTYRLPDIGAGFIIDVGDLHEIVVSPSLQIELLEVDTHIPYVRTLKIDAGLSYMRGFIYIGKLFTSIFEISAGFFIGYDFEDKEPAYGVAATIIRF